MTFENNRDNAVGSDEGNMQEGIAAILQAIGNPMPLKPLDKDDATATDDQPEELETEQPPHEEDSRSAVQKEAAQILDAIRSLGEAMQKALKMEVAPMPRDVGPAARPQDGDQKKSGPEPSKPVDESAPAVNPAPTTPRPEVAPPPRRVGNADSAVASLDFGNIWSSKTV